MGGRWLSKNRSLLGRERGGLRLEHGVVATAQRILVHLGDENSLQTYIREHEDSVRAELTTLRERAKFDLVASSAMPAS